MKLTKKERTGSEELAVPTTDRDEGPEYPYGLEISLEKEGLAKLGLDIDDFIVGGEVEIICHAEITRTSESAGKNNLSASVSIQITDMAMLARPIKKRARLRDLLSVARGERDLLAIAESEVQKENRFLPSNNYLTLQSQMFKSPKSLRLP